MKKFRSKIAAICVMLTMMICFAALAQADDISNGSQGGTLSTGAPPPAPPPVPVPDIDLLIQLLLSIPILF